MNFDGEKFAQKLGATRYAELMSKRDRLERELHSGRRLTILEGEEGDPIVLHTEQLFRGVAKCASSEYKNALSEPNTKRELAGIRIASDLRALGSRFRRGLHVTRRILRAVEQILPQD